MKSQSLATALGFISTAAAAKLHSPAPVVVDSPVGYGAGVTGGAGGNITTVTTCADLIAATNKELTTARIVYIDGLLDNCGYVSVGSNISIFGKGAKSGITNSGFHVRKATNVILQNLALGPAPPKFDIVTLEESTKIWIDHNTFISHGLSVDKDDYDGLLDITHASDAITVSWNTFTGHWKGSLVGHSDNNGAQDTGKLHITYHHNLFDKVNSRLPSVRFGSVHVFNQHVTGTNTSAVHARMGAQIYVENSVFHDTKLAMVTDIDSDAPGSICDVGNLLTGNSTIEITQTCNLTIPYPYTAEPVTAVVESLAAGAGAGKVSP
ncbi:hypothetical protein WAI453_008398 [Rhynchosporium graminicola]|uniref:Related to pectate lyase 1 n=1 Tax=Rhynchosporium graminicola TaxID=2792576 RepID=A0A1E1KLZ0_9HELO|nr:related to pectate lyase 1 [Rhynchosporium commune]